MEERDLSRPGGAQFFPFDDLHMCPFVPNFTFTFASDSALVAGAWTERKKIFHGGSFLKLADDNMDIQNPEAQNRDLSGF